jgi:hypothetical protein
MWKKYPPITACPIPNSDDWEIIEDYTFEWKGVKYTIEAPFVIDGASIPRLLWPVITSPFHPRIVTGGGVHDFIFRSPHINIPFPDANLLLKHIITDHGLKYWKCKAVHKAVALCGKKHYQERVIPLVSDEEIAETRETASKLYESPEW